MPTKGDCGWLATRGGPIVELLRFKNGSLETLQFRSLMSACWGFLFVSFSRPLSLANELAGRFLSCAYNSQTGA